MASWTILVNIGALLCVVATFASSLKSIWCFPIWIVANVILGSCDLYSCMHGQPVWGRVALDVLQFAISIFGWWNWHRKDGKNEKKDFDGKTFDESNEDAQKYFLNLPIGEIHESITNTGNQSETMMSVKMNDETIAHILF